MSDPVGCEKHPVANGWCVHCLALQRPSTLMAEGDVPVTIPAYLAHDLIDFVQSVAAQWGDDYLFTKFGHTEDVPILVGSLQVALAAALSGGSEQDPPETTETNAPSPSSASQHSATLPTKGKEN